MKRRDFFGGRKEERKKQWEENALELLHLGGTLSDAMVKAGEHYGAKIPRQKK